MNSSAAARQSKITYWITRDDGSLVESDTRFYTADDGTYTIESTKDSIGFVLGPSSKSGENAIVILELSDEKSTEKIRKFISVGDILVSVNERSVLDEPFSEVALMLRTLLARKVKRKLKFLSPRKCSLEKYLKKLAMDGTVQLDMLGFKCSYDYLLEELSFYAKNAQTTTLRDMEWVEYLKAIGGPENLKPAGVFKPSNDLKAMVRRGIPVAYRSLVWQHISLSNLHRRQCEAGYYAGLLARVGELNPRVKDDIEKDVDRTFPEHTYFETAGAGEESLRRVLQAFAVHNPDIGYCQSLNFVAGMMLILMQEEDAFWLLVTVVEHLLPPDYYTKSMVGTYVDQFVLSHIIKKYLPRINQAFEVNQLQLPLITVQWFMCIFVNTLRPEVALRVWDMFLNEGSKVIFRVAAALFKMHEKQLLAVKDAADLFSTLRGLGKDVVDADHLISIAYKNHRPHRSIITASPNPPSSSPGSAAFRKVASSPSLSQTQSPSSSGTKSTPQSARAVGSTTEMETNNNNINNSSPPASSSSSPSYIASGERKEHRSRTGSGSGLFGARLFGSPTSGAAAALNCTASSGELPESEGAPPGERNSSAATAQLGIEMSSHEWIEASFIGTARAKAPLTQAVGSITDTGTPSNAPPPAQSSGFSIFGFRSRNSSASNIEEVTSLGNDDDESGSFGKSDAINGNNNSGRNSGNNNSGSSYSSNNSSSSNSGSGGASGSGSSKRVQSGPPYSSSNPRLSTFAGRQQGAVPAMLTGLGLAHLGPMSEADIASMSRPPMPLLPPVPNTAENGRNGDETGDKSSSEQRQSGSVELQQSGVDTETCAQGVLTSTVSALLSKSDSQSKAGADPGAGSDPAAADGDSAPADGDPDWAAGGGLRETKKRPSMAEAKVMALASLATSSREETIGSSPSPAPALDPAITINVGSAAGAAVSDGAEKGRSNWRDGRSIQMDSETNAPLTEAEQEALRKLSMEVAIRRDKQRMKELHKNARPPSLSSKRIPRNGQLEFYRADIALWRASYRPALEERHRKLEAARKKWKERANQGTVSTDKKAHADVLSPTNASTSAIVEGNVAKVGEEGSRLSKERVGAGGSSNSSSSAMSDPSGVVSNSFGECDERKEGTEETLWGERREEGEGPVAGAGSGAAGDPGFESELSASDMVDDISAFVVPAVLPSAESAEKLLAMEFLVKSSASSPSSSSIATVHTDRAASSFRRSSHSTVAAEEAIPSPDTQRSSAPINNSSANSSAVNSTASSSSISSCSGASGRGSVFVSAGTATAGQVNAMSAVSINRPPALPLSAVPIGMIQRPIQRSPTAGLVPSSALTTHSSPRSFQLRSGHNDNNDHGPAAAGLEDSMMQLSVANASMMTVDLLETVSSVDDIERQFEHSMSHHLSLADGLREQIAANRRKDSEKGTGMGKEGLGDEHSRQEAAGKRSSFFSSLFGGTSASTSISETTFPRNISDASTMKST